MQNILINKLHEYIRENNPDLLMLLEEEGRLSEYLSDKVNTVSIVINQTDKELPAYIIEEKCMDVLTRDLRPSKFNYISSVIEEEFGATYRQLQESGTQKFEVINLINKCKPVFDNVNFSEENEDNRFLRYVIIGTISEYLEESVSVRMK
ncbi:MAG: DUF1896 domain-containing protein [Bacteroidota bacterium]|nr:DUF1896 domain-containing protein [Bacteroidota bacterium]